MTAAQLLADQAFLFGDFPTEEITIGGTAYPCLCPRSENANEWETGGLDNQARCTVLINRNALATAPEQGGIAYFRGTGWRIGVVRRDFPQSPLMLELHDDNAISGGLLPGSGAPGVGGGLVTGEGRRIVIG